MSSYHVERSIRIEANPPQVRRAIEDFGQWPKWSPWLCAEPTAKVKVFGTPGSVGHGYDWDGELVGAGRMTIAQVDANRQAMDLEFLRPFKSKAKVMFDIKPVSEGQTDVSWHMDGNLPFFLFFLVGTMKVMIGMDYARGLKMLKAYVETGSVPSITEIEGVVQLPQMHYLGVEATCKLDDIGESFEQSLSTARQIASENQLEIEAPPGALYHGFDVKQQFCRYTAFVQTSSPAGIAGVSTGTIAPLRAVKVLHRGTYQFLGNAWSSAMAYRRHHKLKPDKSLLGIELYMNDPTTTPEEDWMTEVFIPLRG